MYNANNDRINQSLLKINQDLRDYQCCIRGYDNEKEITKSLCYEKVIHNAMELNHLFTHSVEYTEYDQAHDKYWDRVEESEAFEEYAKSIEREVKYEVHSREFHMYIDQCHRLLNEEQRGMWENCQEENCAEFHEDWQY
tara:strand:- start:117 stop:533 length:417 start_codon:yes stop_codon:yes gene_type:complete